MDRRAWQATVSVQFSLVTPTLCDLRDCSTPGFPVHHQLLELAQTHVHQVRSEERRGGKENQTTSQKQNFLIDVI